jgi:leader peptidase (prepilin peptidase)/N-methyltransferase
VHEFYFWQIRPLCSSCNKKISVLTAIPLVSWLVLRGRCPECSTLLSFLDPLIELDTALLLTMLTVAAPLRYVPAYMLFFSALIITIRTDLETLLISRFVTLFLAPAGLIFSYFNLIPISLMQAMAGFIFGYSVLYFVAYLFHFFTQKEGLGQGDVELLAFIGAFTGVIGCWLSLLIGSISGSLVGLILMITKKEQKLIPFGPFLALGAITYLLLQQSLLSLIFV